MRAFAALTVAAVTSLSGCSFFKAITNPSSFWAFSESSPMSVVVRRAEVAENVADHVERLVGETPMDEASTQALALTTEGAKSLLDAAAADPVYASVQQPVRVVPAEAWLKTFQRTCARSGESKSLIEMLGDEVAAKYREVSSTGNRIAALKGKISELEEKSGADGVSAADKKAFGEEIKKHEEEVAKLEKDYEPAVDKLLEMVRTAASKASPEDKKALAPVVVNLAEAVDDARNANSAAIMRYPMALPGLQDDLPAAVKRFAADVIEEQTGHRPDMNGLKPDVKLEGTDVKLTLNGIPHDKLGDLDPGAIVTETTTRTTEYVGATVLLLGSLSETEERLGFQADLLEAWRSGLGASVGATPGAVDISGIEVAVQPGGVAAPKSGGEIDALKAKRSLGGIRLAACQGPSRVAKSDPPASAKTPPVAVATAPAAKPAAEPARDDARKANAARANSEPTPVTPSRADTNELKIRRTLDDPRASERSDKVAKRGSSKPPVKTAPRNKTAPSAPAPAAEPGRALPPSEGRALPGEDGLPARYIPGS